MTSAPATARTEADSPDSPAQGLAVLCACLLMLAALVDSQVVGAIAPQVAAGVGASKAAVAASVTAYSIAAACVALLLARGTLRGRPAAWLPVAAVVFVAGAAVAAAAPHVAVFWAGRAVAGLAGGLVSALVVAALAGLLVKLFPLAPSRRGDDAARPVVDANTTNVNAAARRVGVNADDARAV